MIKLIASDMDGTLLNSNKQLSPSLYGVLKKLNDKGIVFVAISGREIFSLKEIFKDVEEDIVYASTVYSESIIPCIVGKKWKLKVKYVRDITKVEDKILKITTFGNEKIINRALEALSELNDKLMITKSGSTCFDICKLGGTKKQGINILQKRFNVGYNETMVFGDHMNDLEMMSSAYYSYAMENAEEEVKKNARFIAETNDDDGVIKAIKEVAFCEEELNSYDI